MRKVLIILFVLIFSLECFSQKKERTFTSIPFLSVYGVYTKNLSDFKSIFPNSAGAYATYSLYFPTQFSLDIRTGYIQQSTTDSTASFSQTIIPFHIGGRYFFTDFTTGSRINPYVSFMNGYNLIIEDVKENTILDTNSSMKGRYEFQVGVGVRFFPTKKLMLDFNANYNNNFYQTDAMLTGFEYNLGIGYKLR